MPLRVVVLGQVPPALEQQLGELAGSMDLTLIGPVSDLAAAQTALSSPVPDIAVVSTALLDGSAFSFIRGLAANQRPVSVIFVGSKDEDAVAAFELQATDFVLWPAPAARVHEALTRARQQVLQLALLRTADELQRLLGEATAAGGVDLGAVFNGRLAAASLAGASLGNGNGHADANGNGHGQRRRRTLGGASTGTLIATSPWRAAPRPLDGRVNRVREGAEEAVLDLSLEDGGRSAAGEGRPLRVLVREGRRTRFVPLADVDWFEADGNYIRVHAGGERYRTRGTITAIEAALDPRQFVRIHRRIVVNMDRVREMSPLPGGDGLLMLGNGSTLRLSRTYRSRVR
ncbi:MAG TPA: hypothetical protein DGD08_16450 [Gemmatimonas aurantiaca]|uniref:LytTR family DNA binding protein n=2 Tax=Gemmatimonas aurantiaca TaxID=173480 RepID=C1A6A0_GEMAT|nr:LytTR family DNA-binding domain-containing protein [Gemmatimonas aurantiaca]BAH37760.1 LytTR family DNA binding protein [Gemmatimonas aurantiaca T-27]HCT58793.1 hypothetical protein [Gemmatimonas aurantiaca]